jgi:hypothetical protein
MLLVEVSVLVFLMQGLAPTTHQALVRTLAVAGGVAGAEAGVKAIYIYALHVPLLLDGCGAGGREERRVAVAQVWGEGINAQQQCVLLLSFPSPGHEGPVK